MFLLNNASFRMMEKTLDAATLRQKVTVNNIANVDTPYYKRSDVRFEELLQQETNKFTLEGRRTDPRHIPIPNGGRGLNVTPQIEVDEQSVINNNLNNVDIDSEMSLLAKNQLRYNVVVQQVNQDIKHLRTAIQGRN